MNYFFDLG